MHLFADDTGVKAFESLKKFVMAIISEGIQIQVDAAASMLGRWLAKVGIMFDIVIWFFHIARDTAMNLFKRIVLDLMIGGYDILYYIDYFVFYWYKHISSIIYIKQQ